ncbi:methylmalonyl-CoA epimerase [Alkalicoccus urumqiensis]|uniref:Methylmalonyl-CoA epimerase n=1 Tax=Alkalicoccus urumqiensis TaxID=1548213 RepID=A0A2P6MKD9_ALKUR|nr:methylmalonyl-CoA epimerase [Alkalicoccus urumqiensis]PRO66733.1 methylmalonyl-CoA epimerase [Alkalicoccus urumqiensis]
MKRIRVLIAKPGLDGHDRGALVIAQALRDAGMEVIYTGLRQSPEKIVRAAVQEDVDVIGLSSLSGAHNTLFPAVMEALKKADASDIPVIGGGVIPQEDIIHLESIGVARIFTPGTPTKAVAAYIQQLAGGSSDSAPPKRIEHIGIAVHSIEETASFYAAAFQLSAAHVEEIPSQKVRAAFIDCGSVYLELIEPTDDSSPVAAFLKKRGPGLHHIAFEVSDLKKRITALKENGFPMIDEAPRSGGRGHSIAFMHPKASGGTLIELMEEGADDGHVRETE